MRRKLLSSERDKALSELNKRIISLEFCILLSLSLCLLVVVKC
jgi:hypothetical protein